MDDSRISEIAEELDQATPKEGAKVDWRNQELVANKQGLIRLAVECLHAAIYPLPPGMEFVGRDWSYLWIKRRKLRDDYPVISRIARTENVELPLPPPLTRWEKVKHISMGIFSVVVLLFLLACVIVGFITIVSHL